MEQIIMNLVLNAFVAARVKPGTTLLLVVDEDTVRLFAKGVPENAGCRVLDAGDGCAAIEAAERFKARIDLMITDKSVYTENAIVHHGVLDPDLEFLQKPFNQEQLLGRIEAALAAP